MIFTLCLNPNLKNWFRQNIEITWNLSNARSNYIMIYGQSQTAMIVDLRFYTSLDLFRSY